MTTTLPPHSCLENLKKQAKTLLRKWRAGDAHTLARIRTAHPRYPEATDQQLLAARPRLADCQLILSREAGFENWPQMKVAIQTANRGLPDEFVALACLCYDDPHYDHRSFHARAHEMLRKNRWLSEATIWSAAAAGNTDAVESFLDEDPGLANRPGPHGWAPLICACYARVKPLQSVHSTYAVARLLLDRGANPNAYTLKHNDPPGSDRARRFTALTGLFGGGSTGLANQPPHPQWRELGELLLGRGADPGDDQALAINQDACLEMLLRHGLKPDATGPGGISLMGRALSQAARRGDAAQVRLLLAHRARTDEKFQGKLPWEHAMRLGHLEVAGLLKKAGAAVSEPDEVGQFISMCMAGDEAAAQAMLARTPDLSRNLKNKNMVQRAVATRRTEAVKLVLDLGFDPNRQEDNAAIHMAGVLAQHDEILRLLLVHGASLTLRDPWYDGTGIGWADFFAYTGLRDRLLNEPGICLLDALDFDRLDRVPDILAQNPAALERPFAECLSRAPKPEDWQTPLVRMVVGGKAEAVRVLLQHGADIAAHHPDGRSLLAIAQDLGSQQISHLLDSRSEMVAKLANAAAGTNNERE